MSARALDTLHEAPDSAIQKQHKLLEELRAQPYFRHFEPRAYATYERRHFSPIDYLEDVGIEKISEIVQHGYSLQEICAMMNVSTAVMRKWIQRNRAFRIEIDEAQKWSADNLAYKSVRVIENSSIDPAVLAKNKAVAESYRWLAERHNKEVYGTKTIKHEGSLGVMVQYNFNINGPALQQARSTIEQVAELTAQEDEAAEAASEEQELMDYRPDLPSLDFGADND